MNILQSSFRQLVAKNDIAQSFKESKSGFDKIIFIERKSRLIIKYACKKSLKGCFQVKQNQTNKDLLTGDDAIGRGAIEAGISHGNKLSRNSGYRNSGIYLS